MFAFERMRMDAKEPEDIIEDMDVMREMIAVVVILNRVF